MSNTKQTRRLTLASAEALLHILEALPGALLVLDEDATIVYANVSAQALTGATPEHLCGNTFWRAVPHLVSAALYQAMCKTRETQEPTEVEYVSPVTQDWLDVYLAPISSGLVLHFHEKRAPLSGRETFSPNERLVAEALESLYVGVGVLTPEGILLEINEAPLEDAQIRREEVIGLPFAQTRWWSCSPASQEQLRTAIKRASSGETVCFETVVHPREGMELSLEITITPHRDVDQRISSLVYVGTNITERKRAEAEIRALIDAIPQLVWTGRPGGFVDYYNQRWADYTGLSIEEAQGNGWTLCAHPDDRQHVLSMWQRAVQTGGPYETELRLRESSTGAYRWFLMQATPYKDEQGTVLKYICTYTDIDEQKRAGQQLKTSEENWRVLAEAVPHLIWAVLPDGRVEYTNQQVYDYLGTSPEHSLNEEWRQFVHPDDYERFQAARHYALETKKPYELEFRLRNGQTGAYRWFLGRSLPVYDETGLFLKWFGTCTDIEEQKQVEQQLKASREELRVLLEMMPQLVWTTRPDGFLEYGNQHLLTYLNVPLERFNGDQWLQFIHPDDRQKTWAPWQMELHTGQSHDVEYRLREGKTGNYHWFLVRGVPFTDEQGRILQWFGTCTNIDEQKRLEEALRQSQALARTLMNSSIIGVFLAEGGQILEANDAFLHMTGYTREELRAGTINWQRMTSPEYLTLTQQAHQELDTQQVMTPYEKEYVCKDGSRLPVVVGSIAFEGHWPQHVTFVLDNSARKELEQRKDDFINMASHELRNPLTALKMQTQLVRKRLEKQSHHEAAAALSRVEGPVKQLERLIGELLDVSKIQAGNLEYRQETVDIDALLREIIDTMQHLHPSHTLRLHGMAQSSLLADRDRLGQVFTNLISNAIKYAPNAEIVEIDLNASEDAVTIRVRDHGLGIPREQHEKIFERFYRVTGTKQRAIPGLGMGLYIVAEIVKCHGGTITVESEVGKGSTFMVILPKKRDA